MDRLYPKFNRKSQPISIIRAKRELWRKNRNKPAERVPPIKLQNSYSICENRDEFNLLYDGIRNWNWNSEPEKPIMDKEQAIYLLGDMKDGKILKRVESINLAMGSLISSGEIKTAKTFLPLVREGNPNSSEVEALIKVKEGDFKGALTLLAPLSKITQIGMLAYEELIDSVDNVKVCELIYKSLLEKYNCPTPKFLNSFIHMLTKNDFPEKAFKEYTDVCRKGFQPTEETFHSLIYTTSKNKDYFPEMIDTLRQIRIRDFSLNKESFDHLIFSCSKVGNLSMALEIWKSIPEYGLIPALRTYTNMFWAMSSCETNRNKLSIRREYTMETTLTEISETAKDMMEQMRKQRITPDLTAMSAYLSIFCNCRDLIMAEQVFTSFPYEKNTSHYEMMFALYDSLKDSQKILSLMGKITITNPNLNFPALRHAIRTMALNGMTEVGCDILHYQVSGKVKYEDVKELYHAAYTQGKLEAMQYIRSRCQRLANSQPNPFSQIRQQSIKLGGFLMEGYGHKAPKIATDPPNENTKLKKIRKVENSDFN